MKRTRCADLFSLRFTELYLAFACLNEFARANSRRRAGFFEIGPKAP